MAKWPTGITFSLRKVPMVVASIVKIDYQKIRIRRCNHNTAFTWNSCKTIITNSTISR